MVSRRIFVALLGVLAVPLALVSLAWACVPAGSVTTSPSKGLSATTVSVTVSGFPAGAPVEVRWNSTTGAPIASGTGPSFNAMFTVPTTAPAFYTIIAATTGEHAGHSEARASFEVTAPAPPPPPPPPVDPGQQPPPAANPAPINPFTPAPAPAAAAVAPAPGATPAGTAPRLPNLGSAVSYTAKARKQYTLLTALSVRPARSGSTVRLSCSGKACPFGTKTRKVTKDASKLDLRSMVRGKRLRPGAKLEIRVTKPGNTGVARRLTIRAGRSPKSEKLCFAPGAAKPAGCSA